MIIPTPEFDPLFANDGIPFAEKMRDYIQREFADLLATRFVAAEINKEFAMTPTTFHREHRADSPHKDAA